MGQARLLITNSSPLAISLHLLNVDMDTQMSVPHGLVVSRVATILGLDIGAIIISTVIISLRLYSRFVHTKTAGLDDYLAIFAWVCITF